MKIWWAGSGASLRGPALLTRVEIDRGRRPARAPEELANELIGAHREDRVTDSEASRQLPGESMIGPGLPLRLDDLVGELEIVGPVRPVDVLRLQIGRGRQHDVRVPRGVGQERIVHDREEILTSESPPHGRRVGTRHRRVVAGHEEGADRRIRQGEQRLSES